MAEKGFNFGAAHPFYWKPKLRISDIYENEAHNLLLKIGKALGYDVIPASNHP